jgi:hypothetical protein
MRARQKKSASELRTMVMQEVRQRGGCDGIMEIAIYRPVQGSEHHPNWDAAFTMNGYTVAPEAAFRLIGHLQSQFECDWL